MKRREFITLLGGAAAWPLAARAQQAAMPVIGFLRAGTPPKSWVDTFHQGLRDRGYIDGKNVVVEFRFSDGSVDELPQLAEELVRLKADVILASAAHAALAAKNATTRVPIVFAGVTHPVEIGLVPSLARPVGNVTGVADNPADLGGKRLELLREFVPKLRRVAVLLDRTNPTNAVQLEEVEVAARALGIELEPVLILGPNDFEAGFNAIRADGLLVLNSSLFTTHRARIVMLAATSALPAIYGNREFPDEGGLVSYNAHTGDSYKRAATYVDKILKGAKPADLPVEQPTKLALVINLKTAKALGLEIPPTLLSRADEVIE